MELVVTGSADRALVEKWDSKLKDCQQARINFEKQWHLNLSFYFGRQWIVASRINGGFALVDQVSKEQWRVRHTSNKILPRVRIELTKLSKEEPQFFCMPKSTDESDRLAAMAGDAIAEFILRTKYFNRKRLEATFWTLVCGTAFLKNYYDPHKLEIDGKPGKIDFEPVTPFHLLVENLHATDIESQPFIAHVRTMNPEDVYNCYGVEIKPDTNASNLIMDSRFMSAVGIKNDRSTDTKQCFVKEIYVKSCKDFPNGAMFVYAEGKVLYVHEAANETEPLPAYENSPQEEVVFEQEGPVTEVNAPKSVHEGGTNYNHEFPYTHGRFPFVKIDHIPTGMFYAESIIKTLIPLQKEYNRTRSLMLEYRNLAGKPQWAYTRGAFDPKKYNSKPGLMLAIQMGFDPPVPLNQPELSSAIANDLEVTVRDMDESSNQFEVAKGRTPPGVEAASAISYLQEENDTTLYHTVQSLENAVQETGIQVLANVHDYWSPDRIVRMTSKNQAMEVRQFTASDLNPIMDFRVEPGSMAPRSLAAKQAFITELLKMGVLTPQQAFRYMQMSETNKLYEELMLDVRHSQRENITMSTGQPLYKIDPNVPEQIDPNTGIPVGPSYRQAERLDPTTNQPVIDPDTGMPVTYSVTVNPFDKHEIHVVEHENFQKTQEYEMLDPKIQQIIQDHVDEHKLEILKERNYAQADAIAKPQTGQETAPPRELEGVPANGTNV